MIKKITRRDTSRKYFGNKAMSAIRVVRPYLKRNLRGSRENSPINCDIHALHGCFAPVRLRLVNHIHDAKSQTDAKSQIFVR